jgi:serine/threonine protein kinase
VYRLQLKKAKRGFLMNFFSKVFGKSKKPKQKKRRSNLIESAISPTLPKEKEPAFIYNPNQRAGAFFQSNDLEKDDWTPPKLKTYKEGDVLFEHYKVEKVLPGAMGLVYITYRRDNDVRIAIKAPNAKRLKTRKQLASVVKEAETWIDLGMHPNIVHCYFVREIEGIPYIFIEYVDGDTLAEWIRERRCADLRVALDLAIQFCCGMAYAHSKGLIHRDIKPDNILLSEDGTLKVTDFGLARKVIIDGSGELIQKVGIDLGGMTPQYASPEQFIDVTNVGFESDIFSFGLCLWEMICGIKIYDRKGIYARFKEALTNPNKFRPDIPENLSRLLLELVAFERKKRLKLGGFAKLKDKFKDIYQDLFNEGSLHSELER